MSEIILFFSLGIGWAAIHSLTAAEWVKAAVERAVGSERYRGFYRLGYTVVSIITILPLLWSMSQLPDTILWSISAPWSWGMRLIQAAGLMMAAITVIQTGALSFIGLEQFFLFANGRSQQQQGLGDTLIIEGIYKHIRHPLYSFTLLALWATPIMGLGWLCIALFSTAYFTIGSLFEERRMIDLFGDDYRTYQKEVARFIPFVW